MALIDPETLQSVQLVISNLPQILLLAQLAGYIFLVFFFGHIALNGWKGKHHFYTAFPVKAGLGLASLLIGTGIGSLLKNISFFNHPILLLLEAHVILGGLMSSFVFAAGLYLVSYRTPVFQVASIGKTMPVLDDRLARIEQTLFRQGILKPTVKEKEAVAIAEKAMPGYKTNSAKLNNDFWEIYMKKNKKEAFLSVDAYSARVKDVLVKGLDPVKTTGIVIIAVFALSGILFFRGFPDLGQDFLSSVGIDSQDLDSLSSAIQNLEGTSVLRKGELDPSCVDIKTLLISYGNDIVNNMIPVYNNEKAKSIIHEGSEKAVVAMYKVTHGGKEMILGVTDEGTCSATENLFCECIIIEK